MYMYLYIVHAHTMYMYMEKHVYSILATEELERTEGREGTSSIQ